ncbi:MAG: hypothetical protein CM15mP39_08080 [Synechococcus sp.]|nr:MAG: hypothetical protein CM15mP39_08080 [Synechococcus sp.]
MPLFVFPASSITPFGSKPFLLGLHPRGGGMEGTNAPGRMRLEVQDHGYVMLIYPWSQEGASSALHCVA